MFYHIQRPTDRLPTRVKNVLIYKGDSESLDQLYDHPELKQLIIEKNKIKLSHRVSSWEHLISLTISDNGLDSLPNEMSQLKSLLFLDLRKNQLSSLPTSFSALKLRDLDLSKNRFDRFPQALCEMTSLQVLELQENQLTRLSKTRLALDTICLANNKLTRLESWIYNCGHFSVLHNPCTVTVSSHTEINCDRVAAIVLSRDKPIPYLYFHPIECINSRQRRAHTKIGFLI